MCSYRFPSAEAEPQVLAYKDGSVTEWLLEVHGYPPFPEPKPRVVRGVAFGCEGAMPTIYSRFS